MSDENMKNKLSPAFLKWVVIALLILVCVQVLNGGSLKKVALFDGEIEFFEKKDETPKSVGPSSGTAVVTPTLTPESAPEVIKTQTDLTDKPPPSATITLAYSGDLYGCNLPISVTIGNQTVTPQGNVFQVSGVSPGNQMYSISGQIHCPSIGSCQASGQGTVNVHQGRQFNIVWQNTSFGLCTVFLQ